MLPDLTTEQIIAKMHEINKDISSGVIINEKIFDWATARKIVNSYIKSSYIKRKDSIYAWAGLEQDWNSSCREIVSAGEFKIIPVFLRSMWAYPCLKIKHEIITYELEYECCINIKDAPKHWLTNHKSWPDKITINI